MSDEKLKVLKDEGWAAYWEYDYEKAFKIFRQVNIAAPAECNYMLGVCYEMGDGVERDLERAKEFYRKGAELHDKTQPANWNAEHLLSLEGDGINRRHSDKWVRHNEMLIRCDEAAMFLMDEYGKFDYNKGVELMKSAAMDGSLLACNLLSYCYQITEHNTVPDYGASRYWAAVGVYDGDGYCAMQLGISYTCGYGLENPDLIETYYWFRKGALLGDVNCMTELGHFYFDGEDFERDLARAEFWYKQALSQRDKLDGESLDIIVKNLEKIHEENEALSVEQKQHRRDVLDKLQAKADLFANITAEENKKAEEADVKEALAQNGALNSKPQQAESAQFAFEAKTGYNALLVRADGTVEKIKIDLNDYAACKEAVEAATTDKILTAKLVEYGRKVAGIDICGFCDGNGYVSGKEENSLIAEISGYDVIIGDVVLCGCRKYDYCDLTEEQVDKLYLALN